MSGYTANLSGYDEYVPMVDKAVDSVLKKQTSFHKAPIAKGQTYAKSTHAFAHTRKKKKGGT